MMQVNIPWQTEGSVVLKQVDFAPPPLAPRTNLSDAMHVFISSRAALKLDYPLSRARVKRT